MNTTEKLKKSLGFRMIASNVKLEAILWPEGIVRVSALWGTDVNGWFSHSITKDSALLNFQQYEWSDQSNIEAILDHAELKLEEYLSGNF